MIFMEDESIVLVVLGGMVQLVLLIGIVFFWIKDKKDK